ncbi:MAG: hypothetical protein WBN92_06925 [Terriglobia bacterium]
MELEKAFQLGVILAWDDLVKVTTPCSVRIEYVSEPKTPLDNLSVWFGKTGGYDDRVCDYWKEMSPAHPPGITFANGFSSGVLAQTLDFIMKHQDQFTRRPEAGRHGLVLIYPPAGDECTEAATWMRGIPDLATHFSAASGQNAP